MVMTRWILEVGNTRVKWAGFDAGSAISSSPSHLESSAVQDTSMAQKWADQVQVNDLVWVSGSGELEPWTRVAPQARVFKPGDDIPLKSKVTKPEKLGLDRVANVWGVIHGAIADADGLDSWLIVDAGTCVTMDFVQDGMHHGGTISPGIQMRLSAMAQGTAHLPKLSIVEHTPSNLGEPSAVGLNTEAALLAGAVGGLSAEIEGKWSALRQEVPNLGLVITGGDASYLELRSIRPKFADAHLTLKGHHALLRHFHDVS